MLVTRHILNIGIHWPFDATWSCCYCYRLVFYIPTWRATAWIRSYSTTIPSWVLVMLPRDLWYLTSRYRSFCIALPYSALPNYLYLVETMLSALRIQVHWLYWACNMYADIERTDHLYLRLSCNCCAQLGLCVSLYREGWYATAEHLVLCYRDLRQFYIRQWRFVLITRHKLGVATYQPIDTNLSCSLAFNVLLYFLLLDEVRVILPSRRSDIWYRVIAMLALSFHIRQWIVVWVTRRVLGVGQSCHASLSTCDFLFIPRWRANARLRWS